jgi:methylated-DNA-protein-cysteine methyltransferase-like protein
MSSEFQEQVYAIVARIPAGRVVTYGQIAAWMDRPGAARQVGYALAACPRARRLPWHRVINARGEVSPRSKPGDEATQRRLLQAEGIAFDSRGRISLASYQWWP